jgi:hypothetical protein
LHSRYHDLLLWTYHCSRAGIAVRLAIQPTLGLAGTDVPYIYTYT